MGDTDADLVKDGRSQGDAADTAPTRGRWQFGIFVVAALVICVGFELCLSYRNSLHATSDRYHAYVGHRWYLQLPTSSSGYIELDGAGAFRVNDTSVEFFGTYVITSNGELRVRWTLYFHRDTGLRSNRSGCPCAVGW